MNDSKFFLFFAICLVTLFSPILLRAQNNCEWKWVTENEWRWEDRYNPATNKYEPQQVLREVQKYKYVCGGASIPITTPNSAGNSTASSSRNKYSASSDSPMLGTWVYQGDCRNIGMPGTPVYVCDRRSSFVYSQDGSVLSLHALNMLSSPTIQKMQGNWKYTAKDEKTGVLEEFKGDKLVEKGDIKFLGEKFSRLQYTITFNENPDSIGKTYIWNKE